MGDGFAESEAPISWIYLIVGVIGLSKVIWFIFWGEILAEAVGGKGLVLTHSQVLFKDGLLEVDLRHLIIIGQLIAIAINYGGVHSSKPTNLSLSLLLFK